MAALPFIASELGSADQAVGEACRTCRFWKDAARDDINFNEGETAGVGWCRREPPRIIEHLAHMAIHVPVFGGHFVDRDDVAPCSRVEDASLFPATHWQDWCGGYEPRPARQALL